MAGGSNFLSSGMAFTAVFITIIILGFFTGSSYAFGAGNIASISSIEGSNWRHGDIEDTLLSLVMSTVAANGRSGKKFDSMSIKRIYFGNWLRDYSQAVDVGALKAANKDTIRILLWILSFMTFGYATGEFEVTEQRLGCYRPEEHIDNPKDYADNEDARRYDRRLRGPVDEAVELAVDPETGMKNYIANENAGGGGAGAWPGGFGWGGGGNVGGIETSAGLIRRTFGRSIELARSYRHSGEEKDIHEAFRLLGTGLHCLEDFSAHSNYTELALIELGETMVFPHVGRYTEVDIQGRRVFPLVTGTFGGVDFLHSVMGELSDKAIQSEVSQLEATIAASAEKSAQDGGESSILRDLLNRIPGGMLGGGEDFSGEASTLEQKSQKKASGSSGGGGGKSWGSGNEELGAQIYPFLEFHDKLMKAVAEAIDSIPGLTAIMEKLSETVTIFVFSLLAPYVLPILAQVKTELMTGSEEVIASSRNKQHIVFHDDYCSDPTHSMLSKDHFTNILNEPAGKIASEVVRYVVPILMEAWDNENIDVDRTLDHIVQIFHHPSIRDYPTPHQGREAMFNTVRVWWESKPEREREHLRGALSREGIEAGRNHKGGFDSGHGCGKPIGKNPLAGGNQSFGDMGGILASAVQDALREQGGSGGRGGTDVAGLFGLAGAALGSALGGSGSEVHKTSKAPKTSKNKGDKYSQVYGETKPSPSKEHSQQSYGEAQRGYGETGTATGYGGKKDKKTSSYTSHTPHSTSTYHHEGKQQHIPGGFPEGGDISTGAVAGFVAGYKGEKDKKKDKKAEKSKKKKKDYEDEDYEDEDEEDEDYEDEDEEDEDEGEDEDEDHKKYNKKKDKYKKSKKSKYDDDDEDEDEDEDEEDEDEYEERRGGGRGRVQGIEYAKKKWASKGKKEKKKKSKYDDEDEDEDEDYCSQCDDEECSGCEEEYKKSKKDKYKKDKGYGYSKVKGSYKSKRDYEYSGSE